MKPQRPETADRVRQIEREIARLGLRLQRLPSGTYRILGQGVDVLAVDLRYVNAADLTPHRPIGGEQ